MARKLVPSIVFEHIVNGNVFKNGFENLKVNGNNCIEFRSSGVGGSFAVVYAPNGTGKTMLCNTLSNTKPSKDVYFDGIFNGKFINCETESFHIIPDYIGRDIIPGTADEYLMGADIRKEYKLKESLDTEFANIFGELNSIFKKSYNITKKNCAFIKKISGKDKDAGVFANSIVNAKDKGISIEHGLYIEWVKSHPEMSLEYDERKMQFILDDFKAECSLTDKIRNIKTDMISVESNIESVEQDDDAIAILDKYPHVQHCIVCDNSDFDSAALRVRKDKHKTSLIMTLSEESRKVLESIIGASELLSKDPFDIRRIMQDLLKTGDTALYIELLQEIDSYQEKACQDVINSFSRSLNSTNIIHDFEAYYRLIAQKPKITEEDLLFVKNIVQECIGRQLDVVRQEDNGKNFAIKLDDIEFLEKEKKDIPLSAGETNFISLAFEVMLAARSDKDIVVIDDPISSFDSIYKNKIAFCILKFLEKKNTLIFSHNTELLKLLEFQRYNSFKLYMLSNTENGINGFIPVNDEEKRILINLYYLICLLQDKDNNLLSEITDQKMFLMAMVPFMRGYAHIIKNGNDVYEKLCGIMHGYMPEVTSVNVSALYEELFGVCFSCTTIVSVKDVIDLDISSIQVMRRDKYPLLADTLKQTLIYYHTRMKVEHSLCSIFNISVAPNDEKTLSEIIRMCFSQKMGDTQTVEEMKNRDRAFFTSRKTLLNEFNHFEGCMDIFQPAIDINQTALRAEIDSIYARLGDLEKDYYQK